MLELPKFLGNRRNLTQKDALPDEVAMFRQNYAYSREIQVYGHSFHQTLTLPPNYNQHRAFEFNNRNTLVNTQLLTISTEQVIRVVISVGEVYQSEHIIQPGSINIEFSSFFIQPNYILGLDVQNLSSEKAQVSCLLVAHVYTRVGDMLYQDCFSAAHIETEEEKSIRLERARVAHEQRIVKEAKAWTELEELIGQEQTGQLKSNPSQYYNFWGSNGNEYAISGNGELANLTKHRKYCLQLIGVPYNLPIADVIMEKINWCKLKADEVESKANDIGPFGGQ